MEMFFYTKEKNSLHYIVCDDAKFLEEQSIELNGEIVVFCIETNEISTMDFDTEIIKVEARTTITK